MSLDSVDQPITITTDCSCIYVVTKLVPSCQAPKLCSNKFVTFELLSWCRKLRVTSTDKQHQCTSLGSVSNLNSQASSPISERWKPP